MTKLTDSRDLAPRDVRMHTLPDDFDPHVLVGKTVSQICLSENTITVHLDADAFICVLTGFELRASPTLPSTLERPGALESRLGSLVGRRISAASSTPTTLTLHLEGGPSLTVRDDSASFESFTLRIRSREIVV